MIHKRMMVSAHREKANETQEAFLTCLGWLMCWREGEILNTLHQYLRADSRISNVLLVNVCILRELSKENDGSETTEGIPDVRKQWLGNEEESTPLVGAILSTLKKCKGSQMISLVTRTPLYPEQQDWWSWPQIPKSSLFCQLSASWVWADCLFWEFPATNLFVGHMLILLGVAISPYPHSPCQQPTGHPSGSFPRST